MGTMDLNWQYLEETAEIFCNGTVMELPYADMEYHRV